ncbi:MAG: hypothetical protein ACKORI_01165, partial [Verrucomicrobiota bacterium]
GQADFYAVTTLAIPEQAFLEVGALEWLPDGRLAVASRRGEIWMVSEPTGEKPSGKRFAHGLHEVLGLAWKDGWLTVTQRPDVSRLKDADGDGEADTFETVADGWGVSGDYHEYAFGSKFDAEGNIWVVLCLTGSFSSEVPFRGWAMRVTPDGRTIPTTSGIRSPGGIGFGCDGSVLYTDNQGPWNGSCALKELRPGEFVGHPGGFRWYDLAPEMGPKPEEPRSGSRWAEEAKRIPQYRPAAVVFPYDLMGKSAAGVVCDATEGAFGPFAGQVFVTDQSHSFLMRCAHERVDGILQGACFPFLEGFGSGSLAVQFAPDGALFVGGTNRGWGSRGSKPFTFERVRFKGRTPFEMRAIAAKHDGFEIEFTHPVDAAAAADVENYALDTFTYIYQSSYGSPEVDQTEPTVKSAVVSADGLRVRLVVDGLVRGHVHHLGVTDVKSKSGETLWHPEAWYTLNEIPAK